MIFRPFFKGFSQSIHTPKGTYLQILSKIGEIHLHTYFGILRHALLSLFLAELLVFQEQLIHREHGTSTGVLHLNGRCVGQFRGHDIREIFSVAF